IDFPTKDSNGGSYSGTHCVAFRVVAGGDDSSDGEVATLDVSKDGGSNWDNVFTDKDLASDGPYTNKVNYSSNFSAGQWGDDLIFKISQDVAVNGTTSTVTDYKEYVFKTHGADDAVTITTCITADSGATSCSPHTSAPADGADYYDVIDSNYKYDSDINGYERYWHDLDDDGNIDSDEPVILIKKDDNGFRHVILPSTGGKVFYAIDHNASDPADIHGIFHVKLKYSDDNGSTLNDHGDVEKVDSAIEYVHVVTLDSNTDDTSDTTHIQVPYNKDGERQIRFHVYKDFSYPDNNQAFESLIGYAPDIYFSLNTPTSSG
ncbi:MAG: hypothetical protein DSY35_03035, partial [Desulfurobacterium sp.]